MNSGSKGVVTIAALALVFFVSGCGSSPKSSTSSSGGVSDAKKTDKYKAQDAQLIERSNGIGVYTAPDNARKTMRRAPDEVVDEGNGRVTQYYNADNSPTSERLQLRYAGGRLVSKEIVPPDANASGANAVQRSAIPESNAANYVDMREYNPKNTSASKTQFSRAPSNNPADNANAAFNDDFNKKLNAR
jgi:outer membrane lipoprotein-sorting protein